MAIAFDAASNGVANPGTSVTVAHTCTGDNRILFTLVKSGNSAGQSGQTLSCTYNGVAMTQIDTQTPGDTTCTIGLFYILAPATGGANVVASHGANQFIQASSASYTGVGNGQPDASAKGTDATSEFTQAVITIADNCWVVGGCANGLGNAVAAATATTARAGSGSSSCLGDNNAAKTPAGSVTLAWSGSGAHALIVASFSPGIQGGGFIPSIIIM